jgi:hypothetical protein
MGQADETAEFDEIGFDRIFGCQPIDRLVKRQDFLRAFLVER